MDLEKIEGLVNIIENSSLTEFTIEEGDLKITMSKLSHPPIVGAGMIAASPAAPVADTAALEEKADEEDEILFITSPIVGTFYSAAAPDIPAFVRKLSETGLFSTVNYSGYSYDDGEYSLMLSCVLKGAETGGEDQ